jgi:hypothetical protein
VRAILRRFWNGLKLGRLKGGEGKVSFFFIWIIKVIYLYIGWVYIYNIVDMGWNYVLIGNIIISRKLYVISLD